jgi:hypothetical protein
VVEAVAAAGEAVEEAVLAQVVAHAAEALVSAETTIEDESAFFFTFVLLCQMSICKTYQMSKKYIKCPM